MKEKKKAGEGSVASPARRRWRRKEEGQADTVYD